MTEPDAFEVATDELIAAFIDWDTKAARIGEVAQQHIDRGERPPRPSALTLEVETRRLTAAEGPLRMPLGYTARIGALRWRRNAAGQWEPAMTVGDAVQTVVNELTGPQLTVVARTDHTEPPERHHDQKEAS